MGEKIFAGYTSYRELVTRIYEDLKKLNGKKTAQCKNELQL